MPRLETRWTNSSVRQLAGGDADPVAVITKKARDLVVTALDKGWTGPPFDPIALADLLQIDVVPDDSVRDAQTVALGKKKFRIEFNPSRPRGRMRYSLAHEIAHTLFPDCADRIRHRAPHRELQGDEWQLEALCNIAAAELLMPVGTLASAEGGRRPSVDALLEEQKRFDVSTEAIFIRAARVTDEPLAIFCASPVESGEAMRRYRLDYVIGSRTWQDFGELRGSMLPPNTAVSACSGIGFTRRADESWGTSARRRDLHVECVGIPPYPGGRLPRVVGLVWHSDAHTNPEPSIRVERGDATKPHGEGAKIIVQVVNDTTANWGGGGFAIAVRNAFPDVQTDFRTWWTQMPRNVRRLGFVRIAYARDDIWVASLIAQRGYGESTKPRIRYGALRQGLEEVARFAATKSATIHMPRIASGQAGGSWSIVEELVRDTIVASGARVVVYDLPGARPPRESEQPALDLFGRQTS